ncbi:MAG: alginate lyase family protein [Desulfomonile tiedjei]|nr:alginate lyase family protein [Desulfomonile tiedjei]
MKNAKWSYYARRLRTLRADEPFYRIRSWIRHGIEKRKYRLDPEALSPERLWAERGNWLRTSPGVEAAREVNLALLEALPAGWWQDESFWDNFARRYPEEKNRLIVLAEKILDGHFLLFQWKEVQRAEPITWSETLEPENSSTVWPARYYSDIDVSHDPHHSERDVKWCWELNRFQHLLWLGASWRLTGRERFAGAAREHLESWLSSVHYPFGVQWTSNLEVALRSLSFMWCHVLCLNSPAWDEGFLSRFIPCMYLHASHLEKELTVHHTEGNHLLGESSALYCISTLYPLFLDAPRWRRRTVQILNRLVPRVILPDGVYAEQATGYFRFIAEFLFQVLLVGSGGASQISDVVAESLAKGLYFIKNLAPDPADVPMIGDSDTGLALGWRLSDFWDFTPLLGIGSVLLREPALAKGLPSFPAESFLMLGENGLQSFESHKNTEPAVQDAASSTPLLVFADGGYHLSRDERFSVIFDAGPLGIAPAYGHGHADGLSFILHYRGKPAIIDPGTFVYNGPPSWRHYFRSAAAHNTVRIDHKDPMDPIETFQWSGPLKIEQGQPIIGDGWRLLHAAVHWGQTVHCRHLIHLIDEGVIILDRVDGTGEHGLEWRFHFDPRWEVKENTGGTFLCSPASRGVSVPPSKNSLSCSPCDRPHGEQDREGFAEMHGDPALAKRSHPQKPCLSRHSSESRNPDCPCRSFTAESGTSKLDIGLLSGHPFDTAILQGSMDPLAGWYSRYYGHKVPSPTVSVGMKVRLPTNLLTAIKPSGGKLTLPRDLPETLLGPDFSGLLRVLCEHSGE